MVDTSRQKYVQRKLISTSGTFSVPPVTKKSYAPSLVQCSKIEVTVHAKKQHSTKNLHETEQLHNTRVMFKSVVWFYCWQLSDVFKNQAQSVSSCRKINYLIVHAFKTCN